MNYPQVDVDELADIIRESMAAQNREHEHGSVVPAAATKNRTPELRLQPEFLPNLDDRYHADELLRFHDRAFILAAYRAILKRPPDQAEFLRDLKKLQRGHVNKIDLLAALRFSAEGKVKNVRLEGVTFPSLVRRLEQLPIIGYGIRLAIAILRLPRSIHDQREFSGYVLSQLEQTADFINTVSARVTESRDSVTHLEERLHEFATKHHEATQQHEQFQQFIITQFDELRGTIIEANKHIAAHESKLTEKDQMLERLEEAEVSIAEQRQLLTSGIARLYQQLQHTRTELTLQGRDIAALLSPLKEISQVHQPPGAIDHKLDALYAALEDRFRGERDEIKQRFQYYLPYVEQAAPVIDLGCGRGEWLEILQEAGVEARGVERNRIQIDRCRALGLTVIEEDFLVYLRSLSDASVGAVTGFHIIEHVSLEVLVALLTETIRVLRSGGVVIFETPNPENVLVGTQYFYFDPTHRHPLPFELMEFLLNNLGFQAIEVLKLHPWDSAKVADESKLTKRFNDYFYGPMDYAILGRKVQT